jgi:hypothetical protein
MKDRSKAARLTTYIHLSPNLPKTIFGENTHWECRHIKIPPSPPFCLSNDRKIIQRGENRSPPLLKGDLEGFYDPASIDFGVALLFKMIGRENRLK